MLRPGRSELVISPLPSRLEWTPSWIIGAPGVGKTRLVNSLNSLSQYVIAVDLDVFGYHKENDWIVPSSMFDTLRRVFPYLIGVCTNWQEFLNISTPRVISQPAEFLRTVYSERNKSGCDNYFYGEREILFQEQILKQFKSVSIDQVISEAKSLLSQKAARTLDPEYVISDLRFSKSKIRRCSKCAALDSSHNPVSFTGPDLLCSFCRKLQKKK